MSTKVLQKVPDVHRMLIDFRKKEAKIVFGRLLGLLFVSFMGARNFFMEKGRKEKRCTSYGKERQRVYAV